MQERGEKNCKIHLRDSYFRAVVENVRKWKARSEKWTPEKAKIPPGTYSWRNLSVLAVVPILKFFPDMHELVT